MFVATSKMVASLLGATSFQCVDDIDAYVGSLEAIVFGLIARHVKFDIRAQARSAYGDGIRAGLFGSDGYRPERRARGELSRRFRRIPE